jgi:NDP-sugar pyrophosphorylase family protein
MPAPDGPGGQAPRTEQVVVLAGGLATRLGPLAQDVPKVLQPVGGRAFLDVMLAPVRASGFRRFHFCLGHLATVVRGHLAPLEVELEITSSTEHSPRGTAGALLDSRKQLDDLFLLLLGDTYLDIDYGRVVDLLPDDALALMVATAAPSGVTPNVRLSAGRVARYDKGGVPGGLTDTGTAVLRKSAFASVPPGDGPADLGTVFERLISRGELAGIAIDQRFYDIGTPARHSEFATLLARVSEQKEGNP